MTQDIPGDKDREQSPDLLEHPSYEELEKKLTETEQKVSEYWDRIVRMQAEADNLAKRAERDVSNAHKYALERFISELIPVIDSLELCINNTAHHDHDTTKAVVEGVQLTYKLMMTALSKFGIQQLNPVSELFNPEYHQAISMQEDESAAPGTVLSVLQKGYSLNQRLLRPALVVVVKTVE